MAKIIVNGSEYTLSSSVDQMSGQPVSSYRPITSATGATIKVGNDASEETVQSDLIDKYSVNQAFSDDMVVTMDTPNHGAVAYLLQFDYKKNLPDRSVLTYNQEITFVDDAGKEHKAKVKWWDDEAASNQYKLNFNPTDLKFGFNFNPDSGTFDFPVNETTDRTAELAKFIDRKLKIKNLQKNDPAEDPVTSEKANAEDVWLTPQDLMDLETSLNALVQNSEGKIGYAHYKLDFDPTDKSITLKLNVTPPAEKVKVNINWSSYTGQDLPPGKRAELETELASYFKTPASADDLKRGLRKMNKAFLRSNAEYMIYAINESMDPYQAMVDGLMPQYQADGSIVIPVQMQPNFGRMAIHIQEYGANDQPLEGSHYVDPENIPGLKIHRPLNTKNLELNRNEIFEYYGKQGYLVMPDVDIVSASPPPGAAPLFLKLFPAPRKGDIEFVSNLPTEGKRGERGPDGVEVAAMFTTPKSDYITTEAMEAGQIRLQDWYADQGYAPRPVDYEDVTTLKFEQRNAYTNVRQEDGSIVLQLLASQVTDEDLKKIKADYNARNIDVVTVDYDYEAQQVLNDYSSRNAAVVVIAYKENYINEAPEAKIAEAQAMEKNGAARNVQTQTLPKPIFIDVDVNPPIGTEGEAGYVPRTLSVHAEVVKVSGFEITAGDSHGKRWLEGYTDVNYEQRNVYIEQVNAAGETVRQYLGKQVNDAELQKIKDENPGLELHVVYEAATIANATPEEVAAISDLEAGNATRNVRATTVEGHQDELLKMLEVQDLHQPLNTIELERVLEIIGSQYLMGSDKNNYTITYMPVIDSEGHMVVDENGESVIRLVVTRQDSIKYGGSVGADTSGLKASASLTYEAENGVSVTPSLGVSGIPEYTEISGGISVGKPWIDDRGTSFETHAGASYIPWAEGYNSQSVGVGFATPLGNPHSPWSVLYGLDLERLAAEANDPTFWLKPNAGIRYMQNGWLVEVKAGPRVSVNGAVYAELSVKVSNKTYITKNHRLYVKAAAGATARLGADPGDATSWALSPIQAGSPLSGRAWACVGLMIALDKTGKWAVGPGVGVTTSDMFTSSPAIIGGLMVDSPYFSVLGGAALTAEGVRPSVMMAQ